VQEVWFRQGGATVRRSCFLFLAVLALSGATQAQESVFEGMPISKITELAKAGDDEAKLALGDAYEQGRDVKTDLLQAAKWYHEAALAGNLDAQFKLANIVIVGTKGLKKDVLTAIKLLETASTKGHAKSQNALALIYQQGTSVTKNDKRAFDLFTKAAEQNLPEAENSLALIYLKGIGVERNVDEAFKYFKRSADKGYGWGLNNLGAMYEQGWGVAKDAQKAQVLYQQALSAGIVVAQKNLQRLQAPAAALRQ
jgi:uncharacterized protein